MRDHAFSGNDVKGFLHNTGMQYGDGDGGFKAGLAVQQAPIAKVEPHMGTGQGVGC